MSKLSSKWLHEKLKSSYKRLTDVTIGVVIGHPISALFNSLPVIAGVATSVIFHNILAFFLGFACGLPINVIAYRHFKNQKRSDFKPIFRDISRSVIYTIDRHRHVASSKSTWRLLNISREPVIYYQCAYGHSEKDFAIYEATDTVAIKAANKQKIPFATVAVLAGGEIEKPPELFDDGLFHTQIKLSKTLMPGGRAKDAHTLTIEYKFHIRKSSPVLVESYRYLTGANTDKISIRVRFDLNTYPTEVLPARWVPLQNKHGKQIAKAIPTKKVGAYYVATYKFMKMEGDLALNMSQGLYWEWPNIKRTAQSETIELLQQG